ncbi:hypothetical protein [Ensifer aridi]|uniref:hypothetical protein n=1 Tax=Ensifer aridi TaxID=1708715 RepID=UPI00358ED9EC
MVGDQLQILEAVSAAASALAAFLAILYAVYQVAESKRVSREATALQAHREYLALCVERPELSSSLMFAKNSGVKDFGEIEKTLSKESEAYLWFAAVLLGTCEQILENVSASGAWKRIIKGQLLMHWPLLKVMWPKWRGGYSSKLQKLVDQVLDSPPESDWTDFIASE